VKIDIFSHIMTPKYIKAVDKLTPHGHLAKRLIEQAPSAIDLDCRFRIMDKYDQYVQVLTNAQFFVVLAEPKAAELARIANDEMAELISKYPDRFVAAIACLPLNNIDAALQEIDRAINELKFRGIELWTPIDGKPIDLPEFLPVYEKMSLYNLPILIHPTRGPEIADYSSESESKYAAFRIFGWPYETTMAMARLVFGRILQNYPNLKFITHHCGAMVPYFAQRIILHFNYDQKRRGELYAQGLTKHPIDYFRMFYNDTALSGNTPALMCGHAFFGTEHLLFGTDMPFDIRLGSVSTSDTIHAIEEMDIPDYDKKMIFGDNAKTILHLPA